MNSKQKLALAILFLGIAVALAILHFGASKPTSPIIYVIIVFMGLAVLPAILRNPPKQ